MPRWIIQLGKKGESVTILKPIRRKTSFYDVFIITRFMPLNFLPYVLNKKINLIHFFNKNKPSRFSETRHEIFVYAKKCV